MSQNRPKRPWGCVHISKEIGSHLEHIQTIDCETFEEAQRVAKEAESEGLHANIIPF